MYEFWTELKIHPKKIPKNFRKFFEICFCFLLFLVKIPKWRGNSRIWGLKQSRNSGDHEFWNHEMRGFPVYIIFKIFCLQFSHISPKSFDGCKEMPWNPTNCENNDNCNHHFDWTPFAKILVHSRRLTIPKFDWHYWVGNYQVCQWGHKLSNHSDKYVEIINRCEVTVAFKMFKSTKWSS